MLLKKWGQVVKNYRVLISAEKEKESKLLYIIYSTGQVKHLDGCILFMAAFWSALKEHDSKSGPVTYLTARGRLLQAWLALTIGLEASKPNNTGVFPW